MTEGATSFGSEVRSELCNVLPARRCCQLSQLGGLLRASNPAAEDSGTAAVRVVEAAQARSVVRLFHALTGVDPALEVERHGRTRRLRVTLPLALLPDDERQALEVPPEAPCCQKAFARGAYTVRGYVAEPRLGYHLEFVFGAPAAAVEMVGILRAWDIPAGITRRRLREVVYVKGSENVGRTLGLVGSSRGLLHLEGLRVFSTLRNDVNRRLNFETANLRRGVESALQQLNAVRQLEEDGRLGRLSPALQEAAAWRLRWPRAGLTELARTTGLGKSQLNHRLRRLVALAATAEAPAGE